MPARMLGAGGVLDHRRRSGQGSGDPQAAYNDAEGVTAKFNLNLLARINRELGGEFDLASFEHHACYNREQTGSKCISPAPSGRRSASAARRSRFRAGETIHTENSYKYTIESFNALAQGAGFAPLQAWSDGMFAVLAFRMADEK